MNTYNGLPPAHHCKIISIQFCCSYLFINLLFIYFIARCFTLKISYVVFVFLVLSLLSSDSSKQVHMFIDHAIINEYLLMK